MHTLSGFKLRGAIYADKQLLYRRYQSLLLKQKFGNCCTCCNIYFVDYESVISAHLSTRFDEPCPPIWDVISIHNSISLLHSFVIYYGVTKISVTKIRRLTSNCGFRRRVNATFYIAGNQIFIRM